MEARDAVRNLEPLAEGGDKQGGENGDDYEGRNIGVNGNGNDNGNEGGNGNGNGGGNGYENHNVNFGGFMPVARERTYQEFLKCQPLNFKGTEGVVGLTHSALTWWNTHKRTIGIDAAYAMTWTELMRRFQELVMLCTRMVPDDEDKVKSFIGGLPDNIHGNKLKGYARSAEHKRRFDNNPRENRGQQPAFKRQNVGGPCTMRCGNCKRVGHMARDCTVVVAPNTQRALVGNQSGVVCYECGRPGHYRKDCPKLKNQNHGNKTGNKTERRLGTMKL
ncbi:putative reverse transcriptase domain-containing protein [Tanacetum coccineum]